MLVKAIAEDYRCPPWSYDMRMSTSIVFDNGVLEVQESVPIESRLRELRWDEYAIETVGYEYSVAAGEDRAAAEAFFRELLPVPEERELFLRMAGASLCGKPPHKKFLVLQDYSEEGGVHEGSGGGTKALLEAMSLVFGNSALSGRPKHFRSVPSWIRGNEFLAYASKRLAIWDDAINANCFERLRYFSSGAPHMSTWNQRKPSDKADEYTWRAFIMVGWKQGGRLPRVDPKDVAFLRRIVPIPVRGTPSQASTAWLSSRLQHARLGLLAVLLDAWPRSHDLPPLPLGSLQMLSRMCGRTLTAVPEF